MKRRDVPGALAAAPLFTARSHAAPAPVKFNQEPAYDSPTTRVTGPSHIRETHRVSKSATGLQPYVLVDAGAMPVKLENTAEAERCTEGVWRPIRGAATRPGDAIAAFQYGIRVAPNEDILYLNLAWAWICTGERDKARDVMRDLLVRKPGNPAAARALKELDVP